MASVALSQQAYDYLKENVVRGDLAAGVRVSEKQLAKQIGIGQTPIREAILRLVSEGLLEQVPRYGTIVRSLGRREIIEVYEVREANEGWAAAEVATRIKSDDLQLLEKLCDQMQAIEEELVASGKSVLDDDQLRRFIMADMAFHSVQVRATGNRRVWKIVNENLVLMCIFCGRRDVHSVEITCAVNKFHRGILDAIRAGDAVASRRCLVEHLRASRHQALEAFDRHQMASGADGDIPLNLPAELLSDLEGIRDTAEVATQEASP